MSDLVKDFSRAFEYDSNGKLVKSGFELKVMKFNSHKNLVAYTFNSDSNDFCKALVDAINEFKVLTLVTGVTGRTCNSCIQSQVYHTITKMMGDKVSAEWNTDEGYSHVTFSSAKI